MKFVLLLFVFVAFCYLRYVATQEIPYIHDGDHDDILDDDSDDTDRTAQGVTQAQENSQRRNNLLNPGTIPRIEPKSSITGLVECYVCTDCPQVLMNTTYKLCPYTNNMSKQRKCVVYAEKYKHMNRPWYIRGCASERGSCTDIRQAHASHADIVTLISCNECDGDRCNVNGVTRSLPDVAMACISLIIFPIFAKFTLS